MKERDRHSRTVKKWIIFQKWPIVFVLHIRVHVSSIWTKKMQNFLRIKHANGVCIKIRDVLLADWSNLILHIRDDYCWFEVFVCHFKMFAVGVRCLLFRSTREAISYFEEEMATSFGEEKSVDTHFCQWLVSVSLYSTFASNISTKNTGSKSYHVHLADSVYVSRRTSEQRHGFSNGVKLTLEASSAMIRDA